MAEFFTMIHNSLPVKILGLGIIAWAFYTLIAHPDRVLIDAVMHKRKVNYEESKKKEEERKSDFDELMAFAECDDSKSTETERKSTEETEPAVPENEKN